MKLTGSAAKAPQRVHAVNWFTALDTHLAILATIGDDRCRLSVVYR